MNKKSVSNVIYHHLLHDCKNNNTDINRILDLSDITLYELERAKGRIPEEKHHKLQLLLAKNNDNYIYENIIENAIDIAYSLFPELIGLCLNQENLNYSINGFVDNSCIIGNCDTFTVSQGDNYTKLSYLTSGPEQLQETNSVANILLLSKIIHLYSPSAEIKVSLMKPLIINAY